MSVCYEWAMDMALAVLTERGVYFPTAISLAPGCSDCIVMPGLPEKEVRKRFGALKKPRILVWAETDGTYNRAWLIVEEAHSHERHYRCVPSDERECKEQHHDSGHDHEDAQPQEDRQQGHTYQ